MRTRARLVTAAFASLAIGLGCNAILGIERAEVAEGDAGPATTVTVAPPPPPPTAPDAGPCDGVDLANDPQNCGRCGHDCLGGGCSFGRCTSVEIATDLPTIADLAVDDAWVYWSNTNTGDIMRAPLTPDAGPKQRLHDGASTSVATSIALYGGDVYFTYASPDGGVLRCPKSGCGDAGPALVVPADGARVVSVDDAGTLVFGEQRQAGRVGRCTLPTCATIETLAIVDGMRQFGATSDAVLWSGTTISGTLATRGDASAIASGSACDDFVVLPGYVLAGCDDGVHVLSRDGGSDRLVAPTKNSARLAVDDTFAYYDDLLDVGSLFRCLADGGGGDAPTVLVTPAAHPSVLAVDDRSVLWVSASTPNRIFRLAK